MGLLPDTPVSSAALRLKGRVPGIEDIFVLVHHETTLGRHPSNRICFPRKTISRFHARILRDENGYTLEDMGSSNGTFVNGERIQQVILHDQDRVLFGDIEFTFTKVMESLPRPQNKADSSVKLSPSAQETPEEVVHVQEIVSPEGAFTRIEQLESLAQASQHLRAHYRLLEMVRSCESEERLLADFLELLLDSMLADCGVILMKDDTGDLYPVTTRLRSGEDPSSEELSISQTIVDKCLSERVAVLSRDASQDERFSGSDSVVSQNVRSAICVPLISRSMVQGVCYLDLRGNKGTYSESNLSFVSNLCSQLNMALDNMRLTRERMQAERMEIIGRTMAEISHSLKNILLVTQGGAEVLDRHLHMGRMDAALKTWGTVRQSMDRMQSLIKAMLDYSRNRVYHRSEVLISDIVAEVVQEFKSELDRLGIQLKVSTDPTEQPCWLDPAELFDAIMNLAVNARDALAEMKPGEGILTISISSQDKRILLKISDNGKGISPDLHEKIFQPFFTTKGALGNGMGLAMVGKFVQEMGGSIDLQSAPGTGASFNVYFPILSMEADWSGKNTKME